MKRIAISLVASTILSTVAFAGPVGPAGEGINYGLAKSIKIPAGQALKVTVFYNAVKETRAQIWYSNNDVHYPTNSNTFIGAGPHVYTTEALGYESELIVSGWSKNCRAGERKCARINWAQEPYTVFQAGRTIGFEDSFDGAYAPGLYDDIQVTFTCLNDLAACPVN